MMEFIEKQIEKTKSKDGHQEEEKEKYMLIKH